MDQLQDGVVHKHQQHIDQNTCRICQGEGTAEDPLFYPCKCRGSIKYIHQGCLEEWLKHSGRRDAKCDICHVKYKFTTVYQDGTPDRVPLALLFLKIRSSFIYFIKYAFQIGGLVIGCGVQIPLWWALVTRFINWALDYKTVHSDFVVSMIYGDNTFEGDPYDYENLLKNALNTYISSLTTILIIISAVLFLFIEHEWVSKDPGFKKLILKKIGVEHRTANEWIQRAADRIGQRQRFGFDERQAEIDRRLDENLRNLANLNRVLEQNNQNQIIGDAVRLLAERREEFRERAEREQLIQQLQRDRIQRAEHHNRERMELADRHFVNDVMQEQLRNALAETGEDDENSDEDPDFIPHSDEEDEDEDEEDEEDEGHNSDHDQWIVDDEEEEPESDVDGDAFDHLIDNGNVLPEVPRDPIRVNLEQLLDNNIQQLNNANADAANPFPNPNGQLQAAEINGDVDNADFELEQEDFIMSLPVYLIILAADLIVVMFLVLFYFFPSVVGSSVFIAFCYFSSIASSAVFNVLHTLKLIPFINAAYNYVSGFNTEWTNLVSDNVVKPVVSTISNVYYGEVPPTNLERLIPVLINHCIIYACILLYVNIKTQAHSLRNPLKGTQRKVFIALFDLICTLKVFLIFGIELFVFPAFCGLLLEFVLTPVFTYDVKLITSLVSIFERFIILRIAVNWGIGTLYMCLFALFVGMTRKYILRSGVLFFIRSPEDPNARLVHDALVRSLKLQLSRIGLSALVYTLFILIGFGTITHTLKGLNSEILPIDLFSIGFVFNAIVFGRSIYAKQDLIKKYVRQYWSRAFKISSAKVRLSSFVLGSSKSKERGYILRRNVLAWIKGAKPDFNQPKSRAEANELFKTTDAQAFFIPDGNLIRAPKSDTISRKFVRKLFIPVTKDDIPLRTPEEVHKRENNKYPLDEFDDSEDELTTTNRYEIVYRPPYFGARVIGFIVLLWIFSAILIGGGMVVSNLVGKPIVVISEYFIIELSGWLFNLETASNLDLLSIRLDGSSIVIGVSLLTLVLQKYDEHIISKHLEQSVGGQHRSSLFADVLTTLVEKAKVVGTFTFLLFNFGLYTYWVGSIHQFAIERPFHYYFDETFPPLWVSSVVWVLHLVVFTISYVTYFNRKRAEITGLVFGADLEFNNIVKNYFLPNIERFILFQGVVALYKITLAISTTNSSLFPSYYDALVSIVLYETPQQESIILAYPLVLALNVVYHIWNIISEYLRKINAEVKEQYYAKGKTLENADDNADKEGVQQPAVEATVA